MSRSLPVGAVAITHDSLDLLERRFRAELASVGTDEREHVRRDLSHRP